MKIQTSSQVSKSFGISTRMLRYYEQIGLLISTRREDYAYRIYDEDAIRRLQQIIILRKLQIPVKQIKAIFDSPDAVEVIKVFEQNIAEMDEQITALSTVKSILAQFVAQLQEKADVKLKLDLLNDTSIISVVNSLSFSDNKLKENVKMEDLNKAGETLNRARRNLVRMVYRPTETVAKFWCEGSDPPSENAKNIMERFIRNNDLFNTKPDFKVFSHGVGSETGSWFFVTIPDDMEVAEPFLKAPFEGGMWAVVTVTKENNDGWAVMDEWDSDEYEWQPGRPRHEVYFNPLNVLSLKNADLFDAVFNPHYLDIYVPIHETEKVTDEQVEKLNAAEQCFSQGKTIDIDLTTMLKHGDIDIEYQNALMILKNNSNDNTGMVTTPASYKLPLKIELRAKTDSERGRLSIKYQHGEMVLRWEHQPTTLIVSDIVNGEYNFYKKRGEIPVNEFVDIEWIFGKNVMAVKVNGEIRHINENSGYIKSFIQDPDFNLSSTISINGEQGTMVTVELLRITEL